MLRGSSGEPTVPKDNRSQAIRREIVHILQSVKRGHVGSALSIVEILQVLYDEILHYDASRPTWPQRDRFILSKGHGCLALYVLLADKGFFPREELSRVGRFDALLGGHPEAPRIPGVETSTGSLGHGLPFGVGVALHGKLAGESFRTFVLLGDGECNEGAVWEAALSAAKHKLSTLTVLVDYNEMQSYASTHEVLELEPLADKWRSFGFAVGEVDGHDVRQLRGALGRLPFEPGRPSALICHTVKGKGFALTEHSAEWHHKTSISEEVLAELMTSLT